MAIEVVVNCRLAGRALPCVALACAALTCAALLAVPDTAAADGGPPASAPSAVVAPAAVAPAAAKAAVVFRIAKFVSWPDARPGTPIRFCVVGGGDMLAAMTRFRGRVVHGREVTVRRVTEPASVVESCDLLYLHEDGERPASAWTGPLASHPVLTFAESGDYGAEQAIVAVRVRREKALFDIDVDAGETAGLTISGRLLQLAAAGGAGDGG